MEVREILRETDDVTFEVLKQCHVSGAASCLTEVWTRVCLAKLIILTFIRTTINRYITFSETLTKFESKGGF
jgi:hypothetical protein